MSETLTQDTFRLRSHINQTLAIKLMSTKGEIYSKIPACEGWGGGCNKRECLLRMSDKAKHKLKLKLKLNGSLKI